MSVRLDLTLLPAAFAVAQLPAGDPIPEWLPTTGFVSVTRTESELSIVCDSAAVEPGPATTVEQGWRLIRFEGSFEFSLTGVLASVLEPLADSGVGIFAVSTYDTDYLLVKAADLSTTIRSLRQAGHTFDDSAG